MLMLELAGRRFDRKTKRGEFCECSARGQEMSWCEERGTQRDRIRFATSASDRKRLRKRNEKCVDELYVAMSWVLILSYS